MANRLRQPHYFPKFLELPRELRDRIYEFCGFIPTECELDACEPMSKLSWARAYSESALTFVSVQVREEALSLLYNRNHFKFWLGLKNWASNLPATPSDLRPFNEAQISASHIPALRNIKHLYLHFFCGSGPGERLAEQLVRYAPSLEKLTVCPSSGDPSCSSDEYQSALAVFMRKIQQNPQLHTVRLASPVSHSFTQSLAHSNLFSFRVESICSGLSHDGCDCNLPWSPEQYTGSGCPTSSRENSSGHTVMYKNIEGFLWTVRQTVKRWHMIFWSQGTRKSKQGHEHSS
ncbi:hypothetical protein LZ32DRAFT_665392 [Colletotrichum eremochloae]|nr:hypothetical protein LZ32DRAFT_665392 [Colletotrichum eremochloae]